MNEEERIQRSSTLIALADKHIQNAEAIKARVRELQVEWEYEHANAREALRMAEAVLHGKEQ